MCFLQTKERWPSKNVNFFMSVQISTKHIWEVCIHLCLSICLSCYSRFMNKSLILMYWFKGISNVSEFHHFEVKIVLIKIKKRKHDSTKEKSWIGDFLIKHDYLWEKNFVRVLCFLSKIYRKLCRELFQEISTK